MVHKRSLSLLRLLFSNMEKYEALGCHMSSLQKAFENKRDQSGLNKHQTVGQMRIRWWSKTHLISLASHFFFLFCSVVIGVSVC